MPYSGIWLMTRKTNSVRPVHTRRLLKGTLLSGSWISGTRGTKGLTRSRNRTARVSAIIQCISIAFRSCAELCAPSRGQQLRAVHLRPLMIASLEAQAKRKETKGSEEEVVVGDARDG